MSKEKTLLDLSGARVTPASLGQATLLVIDAQNEYLDGQLPLHDVRHALDKLSELLSRARTAGAPIIHVVHKGRSGGLFDPDGYGGRIINQIQPSDETIVSKTLPNAFAKTDLDARLRALGRGDIIIAGFATHMCVSATARAALDLGYRTTVVADAAATRALPDPMGSGNIEARDVHRVALAELADRFAVVANLSDIPF